MRRVVAVLAIGLVVCGVCCAAEKAGHPDVTGWEPLFKADLSNAVKPEGVWSVKDGEMTANKDEAIWSDREYENFVVDLEFKMDTAANSGVILYCSDMKDWIPGSVEIQILDDGAEKWKDAAPTWKCGGIFGHMAPSKAMGKKPGEWNRMTITCQGAKVEVVLNGEQVINADLKEFKSNKTNPDGSEVPSWLSKPLAEIPYKGRIGFQGKHADAAIWFRNIKVKEIK